MSGWEMDLESSSASLLASFPVFATHLATLPPVIWGLICLSAGSG